MDSGEYIVPGDIPKLPKGLRAVFHGDLIDAYSRVKLAVASFDRLCDTTNTCCGYEDKDYAEAMDNLSEALDKAALFMRHILEKKI